ncbi:MAG: tRNA (adenosine(37)-N6)-dimethylallyltransferase MiaA [Firmicutes bacterium]|nr:tRNA (adenosine(37)-N6)-dimethylallyltransferase MiaA [Bacillota bacterium]
MNNKPLLVIVGPTAVGKTEVAIKVACRLKDYEIVSADSMLIYRFMDIGTAKPSLEERKKIKHHLIDIIDPDEDFSVADYQRLAFRAIESIYKQEKLPLLVGGTGLYVRAVTDEYAFSEQGGNASIRKKLKERAKKLGTASLYRELEKIDPLAAVKIHPHDQRRIIRALEVYYSTGERFSKQLLRTRERGSSFQLLIIGLYMQRAELYKRIDQRVEIMLERGFLQEVKGLLSRGYSPHLKSMQSIGYRHMAAYLQGELSFEEAKRLLQRDTRRFAKRQLTWFRRDERIKWMEANRWNVDSLVENICYAVKENLYK